MLAPEGDILHSHPVHLRLDNRGGCRTMLGPFLRANPKGPLSLLLVAVVQVIGVIDQLVLAQSIGNIAGFGFGLWRKVFRHFSVFDWIFDWSLSFSD